MAFSGQRIGEILRRSGLGDGTTAVAMACVSPKTGVLTWSSGGLGSGAVFDSSTAMYTASVTKQLVGVLVAQQVLAGRLDPDDRVRELLPSLPRWAAPITIRQLLHHTSGLPDTARILEATGLDEQQLTNGLVLEGLGALSAPGRPAGSAFAYSNVGYVVLAVVLEAVSGSPLPTLARRCLFGPLGMTTSYFAGEDEAVSRASARLPQTVGDGGWWASASDLLTWLDTLNSERLGTSLTRLVQEPGRLDDGTSAGYGWGVTVRPGLDGNTYTHGGNWSGWSAKTVRRPSTQTAVALLTTNDDVDAVSQTALEIHENLPDL